MSLINFSPAFTRVLSRMVTLRKRIAAFVQLAGKVSAGAIVSAGTVEMAEGRLVFAGKRGGHKIGLRRYFRWFGSDGKGRMQGRRSQSDEECLLFIYATIEPFAQQRNILQGHRNDMIRFIDDSSTGVVSFAH